MPGTASVPGMAGWTCDVSVVAICAEASSVGISSTTLTTSASATSSATSCDGATLNDCAYPDLAYSRGLVFWVCLFEFSRGKGFCLNVRESVDHQFDFFDALEIVLQ